jgi:hypothetical protein
VNTLSSSYKTKMSFSHSVGYTPASFKRKNAGIPMMDGKIRFNRKIYNYKKKGSKLVESLVNDEVKAILFRNPTLEYQPPAVFDYDKTGGIDVVLSFIPKKP